MLWSLLLTFRTAVVAVDVAVVVVVVVAGVVVLVVVS